MNKKIIFLICVIGIIGFICINSACADSDSSDWVQITVNDIDFKIPPEYGGGRNASGDYLKENVFEFGLLGLENDKSLRSLYGYESTIDEIYDVDEMEIDGHHAVAYYSNRSIVNHTVTNLFFESDGTIYALSYNGDDVNSTMKKIVSYSPKSKLTKAEFDDKLNKAQEDYIEAQRAAEEAYEYEEGYRRGYSEGQRDSSFGGDDLFGYYVFYKLGQRSRY